MANQEHLKIIKQGVDKWNDWRKNNPVEPDLRKADLRGDDLRGANLTHTLLEGAKLVRTLLNQAKLHNSNLNNATLRWADLSGADLTGADLVSAELRETNLNGAILDKANLSETDLTQTRLNKARLNDANLSNAVLANATLQLSQLNNANFTNADLQSTDMNRTKLIGANLFKAKLNNAKLSGADLSGANLDEADLSNANLHEANLRGVNLTNTKLEGAYLGRAIIDEDKINRGQLTQRQIEELGFSIGSKQPTSKQENEYEHVYGEEEYGEGVYGGKHNVEAIVKKAKALSKKGQHEDAINCFDEALKYAANKSYILLEKGIVYRDMGKKNEEFQCYDQAIELNPKYTQTYMQKAHVLQQDNQHEAAIECLRKGIDQDLKPEQEAILWHNLASAYLWVKNYQEAYECINRSLELNDREHGRMVRDAIKKDMSNSRQVDIPEATYEDEIIRDELVKAFNYFLLHKKGFPENVISQDQIIDVDKPSADIALIDPESSRVLALVEFSTRSQSLDSLKELAQEYFSEISSSNNIKYYIVEMAGMDSPVQFKIFLLSKEDGVKPISMADFPNYEELKQMTANKKSTLYDFKVILDIVGKKIFDKVMDLATSSKIGLHANIPDESYINLKLAEGKSDNVVIQIHRYGDNEKTIALAVAGFEKGTEVTGPKLNEYITKGDITKLSGYKKGIGWERAWLNGNLPRTGAREKAVVYVLVRDILVNLEAWKNLEELLKWAVANIDNYPPDGPVESEEGGGGDEEEPDDDKPINLGSLPTAQVDKPEKEDLLGRDDLAKALSNLFIHTKDVEGLTVALLGYWGEGKSTVMGLIEKHLNKVQPDKFKFANFNAWEYEHTDNIAAGLAQEVIRGLVGKIGFFKKQRIKIKFAFKEYKWQFIVNIACLLAVILVPLALYYWAILSDKYGSLENFLQAFLGVGAAAILAPLLIHIYKSSKKIFEHPLSTRLETYLKLPDYGKHLGLIPVLKRHIETLCGFILKDGKRSIVFVDDLDRCQTECIAKTLDAIRLVMTIPNVIVMIGIDHRIAFKAVGDYYSKLGDGEHSAADIARDYLGKIIQLPVRLLPASKEGLSKYIDNKLFPDAIETEATILEVEIKDDESERMGESGISVSVKEEAKPAADKAEINVQNIDKIIEYTIKEREEFKKLGQIFEFANPRQLLRLRNSYRLLKALSSEKKLDYYINLMRMLFWQEFLHSQSKDIRHKCMAVLRGIEDGTIAKIKVPSITEKACEDIRVFSEEDYKRIAPFVRMVVLPHNEEGVLDTAGEIDRWIAEYTKPKK